jgi:hypothetical protein
VPSRADLCAAPASEKRSALSRGGKMPLGGLEFAPTDILMQTLDRP